MSTITKEQIEQYENAARLIQVSDFDKGKLITVAPDHMLELARIALASLEAEAVAYMYKDNLHSDARFSLHTRFGNWSQEDINEYEITEIPLYAAPPAPVSMKDHQIRELVNELRDIAVEYHGTQQLRERIAKTVRAAMLQSFGNSEQLNSPVIPEDWVACSERMPEQFVEVLACTEDGGRYVAALNQSMTWDDGDFFDDIQYVTHWMPLPSPPAK